MKKVKYPDIVVRLCEHGSDHQKIVDHITVQMNLFYIFPESINKFLNEVMECRESFKKTVEVCEKWVTVK